MDAPRGVHQRKHDAHDSNNRNNKFGRSVNTLGVESEPIEVARGRSPGRESRHNPMDVEERLHDGDVYRGRPRATSKNTVGVERVRRDVEEMSVTSSAKLHHEEQSGKDNATLLGVFVYFGSYQRVLFSGGPAHFSPDCDSSEKLRDGDVVQFTLDRTPSEDPSDFAGYVLMYNRIEKEPYELRRSFRHENGKRKAQIICPLQYKGREGRDAFFHNEHLGLVVDNKSVIKKLTEKGEYWCLVEYFKQPWHGAWWRIETLCSLPESILEGPFDGFTFYDSPKDTRPYLLDLSSGRIHKLLFELAKGYGFDKIGGFVKYWRTDFGVRKLKPHSCNNFQIRKDSDNHNTQVLLRCYLRGETDPNGITVVDNYFVGRVLCDVSLRDDRLRSCHKLWCRVEMNSGPNKDELFGVWNAVSLVKSFPPRILYDNQKCSLGPDQRQDRGRSDSRQGKQSSDFPENFVPESYGDHSNYRGAIGSRASRYDEGNDYEPYDDDEGPSDYEDGYGDGRQDYGQYDRPSSERDYRHSRSTPPIDRPQRTASVQRYRDPIHDDEEPVDRNRARDEDGEYRRNVGGGDQAYGQARDTSQLHGRNDRFYEDSKQPMRPSSRQRSASRAESLQGPNRGPNPETREFRNHHVQEPKPEMREFRRRPSYDRLIEAGDSAGIDPRQHLGNHQISPEECRRAPASLAPESLPKPPEQQSRRSSGSGVPSSSVAPRASPTPASWPEVVRSLKAILADKEIVDLLKARHLDDYINVLEAMNQLK